MDFVVICKQALHQNIPWLMSSTVFRLVILEFMSNSHKIQLKATLKRMVESRMVITFERKLAETAG